MSPASEVCVDASLVVKVVVRESDSDKADALFDQWANEEKQLIAPVFFEVETDSILRQKVALRNELTTEQAEAAFARLRICRSSRFQSRGRGKGHGRSPPDLVLRQYTTRPTSHWQNCAAASSGRQMSVYSIK